MVKSNSNQKQITFEFINIKQNLYFIQMYFIYLVP